MSGKYIPKKTRKAIVERAFERCEYCQSWMRNAIHPFNIDHIIPMDKGGGSEMENLALSCGGCNSFKANKMAAKDPVTNQMAPLYHPRTDEWEKHFAWSDDYLEIIGLTPTGRATIETLKLNRPGLVNIRRLTKMTGEHPPATWRSLNLKQISNKNEEAQVMTISSSLHFPIQRRISYF